MAGVGGAAFFAGLVFGAALAFGRELGLDLIVLLGLAFGRAAFRTAVFLAVFLALLPTGFFAARFADFVAGRRVVLLRAGLFRFAGFLAAGAIAV